MKKSKKEYMEKTHSNRMPMGAEQKNQSNGARRTSKRPNRSHSTHPTMAETRRITTGAEQLEQACLAKAGWRFTQAKDTSFLSEPMRSIFRKNLDALAF